MESNLTEIVKKHYVSSGIKDVDYKNNQLKLVLEDGEIRWYELDGDKLYYYAKNKKALVTDCANTTRSAGITAAKRGNSPGVGFFNGGAFWIIYK